MDHGKIRLDFLRVQDFFCQEFFRYIYRIMMLKINKLRYDELFENLIGQLVVKNHI